MKALPVHTYLRPIENRGAGTRVLTILLITVALYWLYNCIHVLAKGLITFGIDSYGAVWGIVIVNTLHLISISHVGIAVSAVVRVLNLDQYRAVARVAELITMIALLLAMTNLFLHLGRPERFVISGIFYGKWYSPLIWSMTVFTLYFLTSFIYLYLSSRRDLWVMAGMSTKFSGIYSFLSMGYQDTVRERHRHERTLYWLALLLVPIMISVHSVYGLMFGMMSARAGWYNPLQAPYFVLGAIVSGFSAIIAIAALLRKLYDWQDLLTDRLFRVFAAFLAFTVFLYLYFVLSEHLTAQYLPKVADNAVSNALLTGRFSVMFWLTTVLGLILPFGYLLVQAVRQSRINIGMTALAAVMINVALWIKRYFLAVSAQYHSSLPTPRPLAEYTPTHTEWVIVFGSYVVAALLFILFLKWFPIIELPVASSAADVTTTGGGSQLRKSVVVASFFSGSAMILWGVITRDYDYAPVKWLVGIVILLIVPMANCLIADGPASRLAGIKSAANLDDLKKDGDNNE